MPYLRFKGFDEAMLRQQLPVLIQEFARVAEVPQEILKIELLPVVQLTPSPRSVEIFMFPRSQLKHDRIAENVNDLLCHFGYRDVHIFFVPLSPYLYYKEGEPLEEISWLPEFRPCKGEQRSRDVFSLPPTSESCSYKQERNQNGSER